MNTRNVTKEDLPKFAELISCEELAKRDDISFKHSTMAVDDNGTVVAFAIMRQRSLQDFFGGRIPNEIISEGDEDYMDGDEFVFRNEIEENFPEHTHYELIYSYQSELDSSNNGVCRCYNFASQDGVLVWNDISNPYIVKLLNTMGPDRDFNNMVSVDVPWYD